jgi:uncharacterized protein (DUF2235 family)
MNHGSHQLSSYLDDIHHDSRPKMEAHERREVSGPFTQPKQFVLCFDGTGNKFAGDESDTNLVKIYRVGTPRLFLRD